ncbi:DUF4113 domain-containing protein [Acidovorax sp. LjRoot38]|uniref:DUF4113 domain-containing protein n=1 Tax=Acidovorax sp. LjRoot38 TaxID=3342327 RepID=UPI003F4FF00D
MKLSTEGAYKGCQMLQSRKSPNYITCWEEVLEVRTGLISSSNCLFFRQLLKIQI